MEVATTEIIIKRGLPESEIPRDTKETFNFLKHLYGFTARMSELPILLSKTTGVILDVDLDQSWSPMVLSRLLDYQQDYARGKEISASEFKEYIYSFLNLTRRERQNLNNNNIELKLWSILMILTEPSLANFNINNND